MHQVLPWPFEKPPPPLALYNVPRPSETTQSPHNPRVHNRPQRSTTPCNPHNPNTSRRIALKPVQGGVLALRAGDTKGDGVHGTTTEMRSSTRV